MFSHLGITSEVSPESDFSVLFVDDEGPIRAALQRLFHRANFRSYFAGSVKEAKKLLYDQSIRVVVTDYLMPEENGLELLRYIQEHRPAVVRVMMSGHSDLQLVLSAINENEIFKFIVKPWDDQEMRLAVTLALAQAKLVDRLFELTKENERLRSILSEIALLCPDSLLRHRTANLNEESEASRRVQEVDHA